VGVGIAAPRLGPQVGNVVGRAAQLEWDEVLSRAERLVSCT
jgi:hypothetical protein